MNLIHQVYMNLNQMNGGGYNMNYTFQNLLQVYALKQARQQTDEGMARHLRDATQQLMLQKVEAEKSALIDARGLVYKQKAEESLRDALARKWQRKIEGGANVMRKTGVSPTGVEQWTGSWQEGATAEPYEYEGKMHVPKTRAEELAEVPDEARYAYETYMGIPPTFGQEERRIRAVAGTAAMTREETKRHNIEVEKQKEEELGYKKEELGYKRIELKEKESRKVKAQIFNIGMKQTDQFEKATEMAGKQIDPEKAQDDALQGYLNQMQALINFAKTEYGFEGIENEDIFAEYFANYEKDKSGKWVEKGKGVEEGKGAGFSGAVAGKKYTKEDIKRWAIRNRQDVKEAWKRAADAGILEE